MNDDDRLVTATQAAAILGVHRNTVNRWARRGLLDLADAAPTGKPFRGPGNGGVYRLGDVRAVAATMASTLGHKLVRQRKDSQVTD